jgi:hypothetical protein
MKRAAVAIIALILVSTSAYAQDRADFTGVWRMDPTRSESAMQGEPIGPVTVVIVQTPSQIQIETVSQRGRTVETYRLDGLDSALKTGLGHARWLGDQLVMDSVRDVRGVSVTTQQSRRMTADGTEMHVDSILEVQHGYTLARTKNYGAGKDVFVRVR